MFSCATHCLGPGCEFWAECQKFMLESNPLYAGNNTWQYHFYIDQNRR